MRMRGRPGSELAIDVRDRLFCHREKRFFVAGAGPVCVDHSVDRRFDADLDADSSQSGNVPGKTAFSADEIR